MAQREKALMGVCMNINRSRKLPLNAASFARRLMRFVGGIFGREGIIEEGNFPAKLDSEPREWSSRDVPPSGIGGGGGKKQGGVTFR